MRGGPWASAVPQRIFGKTHVRGACQLRRTAVDHSRANDAGVLGQLHAFSIAARAGCDPDAEVEMRRGGARCPLESSLAWGVEKSLKWCRGESASKHAQHQRSGRLRSAKKGIDGLPRSRSSSATGRSTASSTSKLLCALRRWGLRSFGAALREGAPRGDCH